jgi:hypothetical protein
MPYPDKILRVSEQLKVDTGGCPIFNVLSQEPHMTMRDLLRYGSIHGMLSRDGTGVKK